MSVYNGQKYLKEAIESLLAQTNGDFELIVVNDGSRDESDKILAACKDQRIKIITNQKNIGLTKSLNLALRQATGEYVARLDSDDVSAPERLAKQLVFMERHPEIVLVGSGVQRIDEKGKDLGSEQVTTGPVMIKYELILHNPFYHSTIFFRRQIIAGEGGYNEDYVCAQDFEMYSRLSQKYQMDNIDEPLVKFRVHRESVVAKPESQKLVRENALKIIFQNVNRYISVDEKDYDHWKELLIIKKSEAQVNWKVLLMAWTANQRLWRAFLEKEKIDQVTKRTLLPYQCRMRWMIIKRYILIKKRKWLDQFLKK